MYLLIEQYADSFLAREFDNLGSYQAQEFIDAYLMDGMIITIADDGIIADLEEDGFEITIVEPS